MPALHLVRASIDTVSLARWAGERGWSEGSSVIGFDEGRALHHLLVEMFGPGVFGNFRLLVPPRKTVGSLYAYSEMNSKELQAAANRYCLPEHLGILPVNHLAGKPMPDDWRKGQRLGFDLRTRPVRRIRSVLGSGHKSFAEGSEVDAFLIEALRRDPASQGNADRHALSREAVYLDWLTEQIDGIAELDRHSCRLSRFRRTRVVRGNRNVEGPDTTIHGCLTLVDPRKFNGLLARGVGRHRAYGYGMLLLRPPGRPVPKR